MPAQLSRGSAAETAPALLQELFYQPSDPPHRGKDRWRRAASLPEAGFSQGGLAAGGQARPRIFPGPRLDDTDRRRQTRDGMNGRTDGRTDGREPDQPPVQTAPERRIDNRLWADGCVSLSGAPPRCLWVALHRLGFCTPPRLTRSRSGLLPTGQMAAVAIRRVHACAAELKGMACRGVFRPCLEVCHVKWLLVWESIRRQPHLSALQTDSSRYEHTRRRTTLAHADNARRHTVACRRAMVVACPVSGTNKRKKG